MGVLIPDALQDTIALLSAAERANIRSRRIHWPAAERLIRILRRSFSEHDAEALSDRDRMLASLVWNWLRVCLDGPVIPNHASTGFDWLCAQFQEAESTTPTSASVRALHEAVLSVGASIHPASEAVINLVSSVASSPSDRHSNPCVLVVRGEGADAVRAWVTSEGLKVDIAKVGDARNQAPWQHAVLFGPPERYTSSHWVKGADAAKQGGWLISAPLAPEVTVLSWTGHRPLSLGDYVPWAGAPESKVEHDAAEVILDDFAAEAPDNFRPLVLPTFAHEERLVDGAHALQFAFEGQQLLTYFHPQLPPNPAVLTIEDGTVSVTRIPLSSTRVGQCLLFRTAPSGGDPLDAETHLWLANNRKGFSKKDAESFRATLKVEMSKALAKHGMSEVVTRLVSSGLKRDYAKTLPNRLLHPDYIAPQSQQDFEALAKAIDSELTPQSYRLLKELRTARRRAGQVIAARIVERLNQVEDLSGRLRDEGGLVLKEAGLQGVALLVLRDINATAASVPPGRIGVALMQTGQLWHP